MPRGRTPDAGEPRIELLRFRVSESESAEIHAALNERNRKLSDVARELLLAWARE